MKRHIKQLVLPLFLMGMMVVPSTSVFAADSAFKACGPTNSSPVCADAGGGKVDSLIKSLVNTLIYILGAIAVIMVVVGGIRYTTSNGDASGTKSAKDTILYAVIGLVVALLAYAIVNFVLGRF